MEHFKSQLLTAFCFQRCPPFLVRYAHATGFTGDREPTPWATSGAACCGAEGGRAGAGGRTPRFVTGAFLLGQAV